MDNEVLSRGHTPNDNDSLSSFVKFSNEKKEGVFDQSLQKFTTEMRKIINVNKENSMLKMLWVSRGLEKMITLSETLSDTTAMVFGKGENNIFRWVQNGYE